MAQIVLEAEGVTKRYGRVPALDRFSARFEEGKIYGLLGRNGAGKTTLLNILTSRAFASSGTVRAFGEPAVENPRVLPKICYMAEKNLFDRHMKVKSILKAAAQFYDGYDAEFAHALCERFALDTGKPYKALSRGYESILRIVIGLASRCPVTIFDEPVLGLDAAVREDFYRALIEDFAQNPRTYILSTHMIEESADIFDEAVIIRAGRLVEQTSTEALKAGSFTVSGKTEAVEQAVRELRVVHRETLAGVTAASVYDPESAPRARRELAAAGLDLSGVPVQKLFIYLTDRAGEPAGKTSAKGDASWNA